MAPMQTDFVLLHGGGQGSWVWESTVAALRLRDTGCLGTILAIDVPGCGTKRDRDTGLLTPAGVAEELVGDIERAGLRDAILVGHSLAGNLLPAMAALRPHLFRRLVYLSCSIPLPGQTVIEMMGNGMHGENEREVGWPVDPRTTAMADRYHAMYCEDMDAEQASAYLAALNRDDWPASFFTNTHFDFPMDRVPATYIVCERDRILPAAWQEVFARRFAAERVVRIDAGHQAMITRPQAVAEILRLEASSGVASMGGMEMLRRTGDTARQMFSTADGEDGR